MGIFDYHRLCREGKIEVVPTKPVKSVEDLSVSYTPGVGSVAEKIKENNELVYDYTAKGNLVAVITNGTAVLGLGDAGVFASKPVMEGKAVLFKIFADIDVFDIEINEKSPERLAEIISSISPTFGGINLEDIKAPECFVVEKELKKKVEIPVMHDDQWGTATVILAGLYNALYIAGKDLNRVKIVINGAGSSALATAKLLKEVGAQNIFILDSKGLLSREREDLNEFKREFAVDMPVCTLDKVIEDADVFIGLSVGNTLKKKHLLKMSKNPIVFALANPIPEIYPDLAEKIRKDGILATGRSDFKNQINNVLSFPYIFRGALDVRAKDINFHMLKAAAEKIAEIARKKVLDYLKDIYHEEFSFGKDYIIPKPFDRRLLLEVPVAVAEIAVKTGVSQREIDVDTYRKNLKTRLERINKIFPYCSL
ncbi:malate dehydrogenase (oxaloacetate-decarboxylating)(NADP+) [Persephonella hydrogeniphila]|uniref:Malate dehydrogenase (Oxaloacetate-decarboxylating)(NADP+) n=1 Tax=Persephonella hydrogeniphila TaxID=198703 RepID=A0A285NEN2_9AQUI|nr:malic enzyme-like NAD(P)-binding protein [Persephonella hydrogeniphila]SNZ07910.1 malate dehydrogenase (oxaloacetate-decarboxylating)(NADP+) [Persephonella hydrogeniphila]